MVDKLTKFYLFITDGKKHLNFVDDVRNEHWLSKKETTFTKKFKFTEI